MFSGIIIHSNETFSKHMIYLCATASHKSHLLSGNFKYISLKKCHITLKLFIISQSSRHETSVTLFRMGSSNSWTWTKTTPQKEWLFWSNPYKIVVMITTFTEMLELSNSDRMITFTIKFESPDKNLLLTSSTEIMAS